MRLTTQGGASLHSWVAGTSRAGQAISQRAPTVASPGTVIMQQTGCYNESGSSLLRSAPGLQLARIRNWRATARASAPVLLLKPATDI